MNSEHKMVHLTANPKYLDVLCLNCYECVKFNEVNKHSSECAGKSHKDEKYGLDIERDLRKQFKKEQPTTDADDQDSNEKIYKLIKSIRGRLVEVQIEDKHCS